MASLPYPRSHKTISPQKPTQPNHLCASVKSVGGSSTPEASVYSVKSVGEYPPPETSVNSVNSVGGLAQTNLEWFCGRNSEGSVGMAGMPYPPTKTPTDCTDAHRLGGYGIPAIPSYENSHGLHGCAQIRRVWHPCHTHAATKLSSHRIHGTQKRLAEKKNLCTSVKSVGGSSPPEISVDSVNSVGGPCASKASVRICEICGRTCASKLRVGSVEEIRRAAWVWQGCHTLLHLWASVKSVGEYPPLETSVNSVNSVGGSYLPEGSVGSACSVGDSYLKLCWCSGDRCTP